jgi:hypothetical protein
LHEQPTEATLIVGGVRLEYGASHSVVELRIPPRDPVAYENVAPFPLGLWAVTRRLLAEGRDRVTPMLAFATVAR